MWQFREGRSVWSIFQSQTIKVRSVGNWGCETVLIISEEPQTFEEHYKSLRRALKCSEKGYTWLFGSSFELSEVNFFWMKFERNEFKIWVYSRDGLATASKEIQEKEQYSRIGLIIRDFSRGVRWVDDTRSRFLGTLSNDRTIRHRNGKVRWGEVFDDSL
jgi:hypothetical protein